MKNRILLCLCGLTPQVITEAVYCLAHYEPQFIPDKLEIITTSRGKMHILESLLHPMQGKFNLLCKEYNLNIFFDESCIHVVDFQKEYLDNFETKNNNLKMMDLILAIVRNLCLPQENQVYACLSGGRKTMSFYLGMAMQFYAKENDELFHVLVNKEFENHPEFYFPPKIEKQIVSVDSKSGKLTYFSSKDAKLVLYKVPFVRLRPLGVVKDIEKISFAKQVKYVQETINKSLKLHVNIGKRTLVYGNRMVELTPMEMALYCFFVKKKLDCPQNKCILNCTKCFVSVYDLDVDVLIRFLNKIKGHWNPNSAQLYQLKQKGDIKSWFFPHRSRINRKIKKVFGSIGLIESEKRYAGTRYGLNIDKKNLILED
ncbi:CRISPR-associated protein NE0113 (Cas_NE0113) [Desulfonauticus submarinus]|uniref:CRISPR-associated protein NE0113 (Cas_NE0113) n=1 Tax=Desulfonauticus submarinus TaxID=206665 RepID=A0A1H0FEB7_9BACT|nr:CRISPR-associated ring nuclease Csm6 [Desulfonauticus submarinus]SDN92871.1 CRISPR-associated protein NE0113 (Cas_NE0113) [Desulfonauticus submarinus]